MAEWGTPSHEHETLDFGSIDNTKAKSRVAITYGDKMSPDTDQGPKNAMTWAQKFMEDSPEDLDKSIRLEQRRSWGYVLWDEERLQSEWGLVGSQEPRRL